MEKEKLKNTIMSNIECIDVLEGLKQVQDESYDIILIDPPYGIGKDFGNNSDKLPLDHYLSWANSWIQESIRCLKNSGTLYIYGFPEILCHIAVSLKLEFRILSWHYTNKTTPNYNFWQRSYESIICAWKDKEQRIFNLDDVREPYTDVFLKNAAGKVRKATKGRFSDGTKDTIYQNHEKGALPRDIIKVPALAGGAGASERWFYSISKQEAFPNKYSDEFTKEDIIKHPTQKPYELTKRLLLASKPQENGKVLIPFVGSGSECAVAEDLGVEYLGFELNLNYVKLAKSFLIKRQTF